MRTRPLARPWSPPAGHPGRTSRDVRYGLAIAGLEHRYRGVIRVDLRGGHHVSANDIYQWPEQRTALADPVRKCRTAEFHAVSRIDH